MLNRQAKLPGETEWISYGNVSLAGAAMIHFIKNIPTITKQKFSVFVRDEEDGKVFSVDCQHKWSVEVSNLRGERHGSN